MGILHVTIVKPITSLQEQIREWHKHHSLRFGSCVSDPCKHLSSAAVLSPHQTTVRPIFFLEELELNDGYCSSTSSAAETMSQPQIMDFETQTRDFAWLENRPPPAVGHSGRLPRTSSKSSSQKLCEYLIYIIAGVLKVRQCQSHSWSMQPMLKVARQPKVKTYWYSATKSFLLSKVVFCT